MASRRVEAVKANWKSNLRQLMRFFISAHPQFRLSQLVCEERASQNSPRPSALRGSASADAVTNARVLEVLSV